LIDDEAVSILSKFVKLKGTLEPYLTTISINDAVGQGHPLVRPLFLEYPEDPNTWHLDQQYMLGSSLLVAQSLERVECSTTFQRLMDQLVDRQVEHWTNLGS
jgi:alpha-glucosidase (family GH31 glycosyl hydrolase)